MNNQNFGTNCDRVKFLNHLRTYRQMTVEDLAEKSMYRVDTVKAWFAQSPPRQRPCPDRGMQVLLSNLGMSMESYWAIVNQG